MIEVFSHMLWPLLACFVLVGIHAYLGIHVIARKVIFVDLALAQIAALGAVYGVFIGLSFDINPWWIKAVSVLFTLFGAMVFSFTRTLDEKVPHEAIIGIIYAGALSMTILLTANLPHGADDVRQMLAGNILWVTPTEVLLTALLYSVIGVIHFLFRKQFFWLSEENALKQKRHLNVKLWDFLFYATFGVVVTSSVGMGGVLLVFGYLVIPSVIGILLAESTKMRLAIGWASGLLMSLLGVILSYFWELPSGPTIVVLLGLLLIFVAITLEIRQVRSRKNGIIHVLLVIFLGVLLVVAKPWYLQTIETHFHEKPFSNEQQIKLSSKNNDEIFNALTMIKENQLQGLFADIVPFLSHEDDKIRSLAIEVLSISDQQKARPFLKERAVKETDIFIKIEIAQALAFSGDHEGLFILKDIVLHGASEFAQDDALMHLSAWLIKAPKERDMLIAWLDQNRQQLRFDEVSKKYYVNK